jgi:hypothetical protein
MLSLALMLGLGLSGPPATAAADGSAKAAIPASVSRPIAHARTALSLAAANLRTHHYGAAVGSLNSLIVQVNAAHTAGMAQIGRPPTDPESDDLPGPPSVLAVLALEHRVSAGLVGPFNRLSNARAVDALLAVLWAAHHRRDTMLNRVIALPDEGAGADYADGMADTLGIYAQEVRAFSTGLRTFQLAPRASAGLHNALLRVEATNAKVNRAFGGGE